MASVATSPSAPEQVIEYDDFIDQQIATTSMHVKLVDVVTQGLFFVFVLLGALLGLVLVDHWLVGLGNSVRWLSLVGLVVFTIVILGRLAIVCWRRINPAFAAQTVERSFPGLKNGLLNFLLLRNRESDIEPAVFRLVRQQAAVGLTQYPIDTAVDRSILIRTGYGIVAIAVAWTCYMLVSPKSSMQTIQRVLLPWRDIARPSCVAILAVSPGDAQVFRGQSLEIIAEVEGLGRDALATIEFSTDDGQVLAQSITMSTSNIPGRYQGLLTQGETGLLQSVSYRILAGDAQSRKFQVLVSESPHILVDRVEYQFPPYTQKTDEVVSGEGDIHALEGTRVTVYGVANQPIEFGRIELLLAGTKSLSSAEPRNSNGDFKSIRLNSTGNTGHAPFVLRLGDDRKSSIYRGYRLHFINNLQTPSQGSVEHSIAVIPDLRPQIEILAPTQHTTDVPLNQSLEIEIRALDPDFQLTEVELVVNARRERELLRRNLVDRPVAGQFTAKVLFRPLDHRLKVGDQLEFFAAAADNRHSSVSRQLEPNHAETPKQRLRIVAPLPTQGANPSASRSQSDPTAELQPANEDEGTPDTHPAQDPSAVKSKPEHGNSGEQGNEAEQGMEGEEGNEAEVGKEGDEGKKDQQEPGEEGEQGEEGESGLNKDGQGSRESRQAELNSGQAAESQSADDSPEDQGPGGNSQPARSAASDGMKSHGAPADEPLPSDGSRDGEVVERIRDHLEQQQGANQQGANQQGANQQPKSPQNADQQNTDSSALPRPSSQSGESLNGQPANEAADQQSSEPLDSDEPSPQPASADGQAASESSPAHDNATAHGKAPQAQPGTMPNETPPNDGPQSGTSGRPQQDPQGSGKQSASLPQVGASQPSGAGSPPPDAQSQNQSQEGSPPQGAGSQSQSQKNQPAANSSSSRPSNQQPRDQQSGKQQHGEQRPEDGQSNPSQSSAQSQDPGTSQAGTQQAESQTGESQSNSGQNPSNADASNANNEGDASQGGPDASEPGRSPPRTGRPSDGKPNPGLRPQQGENSGPDRSASLPKTEGGEPQGDTANLDYARKTTDLVLQYLRDQERAPDPELLEKLGWTKEDLNQFLSRWKALKQQVPDADEPRGQQLDDVLRGMGLRRPSNALRNESRRDDGHHGNRESGRRLHPPSEVQEAYRTFLRSLQKTTRP